MIIIVKMVSVNSIYRQCSLITCQAPFKAFCMHRLINLHYDSSLSAIGFLGVFFLFFFFFGLITWLCGILVPQPGIELRPLASESSESQPMDRQGIPTTGYCYPQFTNAETEAERGEVTCPTSHSQKKVRKG